MARRSFDWVLLLAVAAWGCGGGSSGPSTDPAAPRRSRPGRHDHAAASHAAGPDSDPAAADSDPRRHRRRPPSRGSSSGRRGRGRSRT